MSAVPSVGDTLAGRYEIRRRLSPAGFRTVYRAFDTEVEVEVTLWALQEEMFGGERGRDEFLRAVREMQAIKHPHLLRLFDAGRDVGQETLFATLQPATSAVLLDRLEAQVAADAGTWLSYAEALSAALDTAHAHGHHHGWLSPSDVVEVAGQIKLCGVGLFRGLEGSAALASWGQDARYLAPEVVAGGASRASSDWYSLAALLLDLAGGSQARPLEEAKELVAHSSPELYRVLSPALAVDPEQRPRSGAEFRGALGSDWSEALDTDKVPDVAKLPAVSVPDPRPVSAVEQGPQKHQSGDFVDVISFLENDDEQTGLHAGMAAAEDPRETSTEASAKLRLDMVSMKPETPVGLAGQREAAAERSPVKPVLRPLSSLQSEQAPSDLGVLAPPKRKVGNSGRWVYLGALLAGAAAALLVLALTGKKSATPPPRVAPASPASPPPSSPGAAAETPGESATRSSAPCPQGMVHIAEEDLCIDAHEAPGKGRHPSTGVSLAGAKSQCRQRGVRLCTAREWEGACRRKGRASWPYGDEFRPGICNVRSGAIHLAGASPECRRPLAIYDMSGNVAEWVEEGQIRGGSALDQSRGRCRGARVGAKRQEAYSDVGFRCCVAAIASRAASD